MISSVTIQGSSNQTITLGFDSRSNALLAQEIADQITAGVKAGTVFTAFDTDGTPPTLPAGVTGVYVQTLPGPVVLPTGYTIDLVTTPGPAEVIGNGSANEAILSDAGTDLTFLASSGSGTVIGGGSNNDVSVSGSGNWLINVSSTADRISALGSVNATINAGDGKNAILLGNGNYLVSSSGDDSIQAGSGAETIDAANSHSDFVQGMNSQLLFIGGAGGATIFGGSGSDTYMGSVQHTGPQLIEGGTGGNNFLYAGDGLATLVGGGSNDQLYGYGSQNQLLIAGSGNETLSATFSSGNDTLRAGSGSDQLIGGSGSDTYVGGSGTSTVQVGSGFQVFDFVNNAGGGSQLVQGFFDPSSIHIHLDGYGSNAINQALNSQSVNNGSVTIGLTDGTTVTFENISHLTRSNFS